MASETPGRELILEAIKARLLLIDRDQGYHSTKPTVHRDGLTDEWLGALDSQTLPALFIEDGDETIGHNVAQHFSNEFQVIIRGYVHARQPNEVSTVLNRLLHDTKRTLQAVQALGAGTWQSGKGQVTQIAYEITSDISAGGNPHFGGFVMTLTIKYREPEVLT